MSGSYSYEMFLVEVGTDGVARLTMNRPEKLNAMNAVFFRELIEVMAELSHDDAVRAVVLTGAGRAFSAGGDIATFPALVDVAAARRHVRLVFDAFHSVERARVPVIAAVNGIAHGGGTEIVCACDYVIAAPEASFGFREAAHGLAPGYGITKGPRKMGQAWTWRLASTAEVVAADVALQIGLVQEVVARDQLLVRAHELAAAVAANPVHAVDSIKQHLNRDSAGGLQAAVEMTGLLFGTEDSQRNVQAFLNRRGTTKG